MSEQNSRFEDNGDGIVWIKRRVEAAHEKTDTQGTITEHTEES